MWAINLNQSHPASIKHTHIPLLSPRRPACRGAKQEAARHAGPEREQQEERGGAAALMG